MKLVNQWHMANVKMNVSESISFFTFLHFCCLGILNLQRELHSLTHILPLILLRWAGLPMAKSFSHNFSMIIGRGLKYFDFSCLLPSLNCKNIWDCFPLRTWFCFLKEWQPLFFISFVYIKETWKNRCLIFDVFYHSLSKMFFVSISRHRITWWFIEVLCKYFCYS